MSVSVTLLSTTVEDEPMQLIMMFKTATEMWNKLAVSYGWRNKYSMVVYMGNVATFSRQITPLEVHYSEQKVASSKLDSTLRDLTVF